MWPRRHAAATARPAHHERDAFRSAAHGPMRRDYALNRFLHLTAKYRRA